MAVEQRAAYIKGLRSWARCSSNCHRVHGRRANLPSPSEAERLFLPISMLSNLPTDQNPKFPSLLTQPVPGAESEQRSLPVSSNTCKRVTQIFFRYTSIKYYNWNLTITFYQSTLPEHLCNVASSSTTIWSTGASHCHPVHLAPLCMLQPRLQVLKTASHAVGPSP